MQFELKEYLEYLHGDIKVRDLMRGIKINVKNGDEFLKNKTVKQIEMEIEKMGYQKVSAGCSSCGVKFKFRGGVVYAE